jgi:hypothetical protein
MLDPIAYAAYKMRLHRLVAVYIVGLVAFMLLMAWAERSGMSRLWLGPIFLFSSLMLYAGIGIYCRTTDPQEYYVAGRGIPAVYNGMAAAADWMSAASFISMAGGLYLQGFGGTEAQAGGLAYVLGWTGGFCLVALLIAPHLRRLNLYTVPDYFTLRYGGRWPRVIAALAAVLCSFTYVIAQIYGIGLIASRLTGVQFEIGILLGLGGVLLCSFLGGMRAITWTQVAQYIILVQAAGQSAGAAGLWRAVAEDFGNGATPRAGSGRTAGRGHLSCARPRIRGPPAGYRWRVAARARGRQGIDPGAQIAARRYGADRQGQPVSRRSAQGCRGCARAMDARHAREL